MRILIAPAKKMQADPYGLAPAALPLFIEQAEQLFKQLRTMSYGELKALWQCNDKIAAWNEEQLRHMDLRRNLTPALFAYHGIQYRYMAPTVFTEQELSYVQEHVRILSGFYGVLRPLDGVTPYRLEMQAKLTIGGQTGLYDFWGDIIARQLISESDTIINLASEEYSRSVTRYLPESVRCVTCRFGEWSNGKVIEKGTRCKMARGEMVRFLAEHQAQKPEEMKAFARLGYRFSPEKSTEDLFVFLKNET